MNRDSFIFYRSWIEAIREFAPTIRLEIYEATFEYASTGLLSRDLGGTAKIAFNFIKYDIDKMRENETKFKEKQSEHGKKGGRGKKATLSQKGYPLFKSHNDNDNVNDNIKPPTPFENFESNFNFEFCDDKWQEQLKIWILWLKHKNKPVETQQQLEAIYRNATVAESLNVSEFEKSVNFSISNGWGSLVVPDSIKDLIKQKQRTNEKSKKEIYHIQ